MTARSDDSVAFFIQKLWELVNDPESDDVIRWNSQGDAIEVIDEYKLKSSILPRYWKMTNMDSFKRMLNLYGFRKESQLRPFLRDPSHDTLFIQPIIFSHPFFTRDHPEFLAEVQRGSKNYKDQSGKKSDCSQSVPFEDFMALKKSHENLQEKHYELLAKYEGMEKELKALWGETAKAQLAVRRHERSLGSLVRMLISLVSRSGSNSRRSPSSTSTPQFALNNSSANKTSRSQIRRGRRPGPVIKEITELKSPVAAEEDGEPEAKRCRESESSEEVIPLTYIPLTPGDPSAQTTHPPTPLLPTFVITPPSTSESSSTKTTLPLEEAMAAVGLPVNVPHHSVHPNSEPLTTRTGALTAYPIPSVSQANFLRTSPTTQTVVTTSAPISSSTAMSELENHSTSNPSSSLSDLLGEGFSLDLDQLLGLLPSTFESSTNDLDHTADHSMDAHWDTLHSLVPVQSSSNDGQSFPPSLSMMENLVHDDPVDTDELLRNLDAALGISPLPSDKTPSTS